MKLRNIFLIGLVAGLQAQAANYYISPEGNDSADGCSVTSAKATLGAAQKLLQPGDTLFVMPGVYAPTGVARTEMPGNYAVVYDLSLSGEKGRPIVIEGITGDDGSRPEFDLSGVAPEGSRVTGFLVSGNRIVLKNFDVTGIRVTRTDHTQSENIRISDGAWNTIENIGCHDGMGIGVYINKGSHHNLIVNCDGYNNYDPVSDEGKGGNNDGFGCHVKSGMVGNEFIGCRAWNNTDDGFDLINCYSPVTFAYLLAVNNGFDADGISRADGNGFKAGGFGMKPREIALPQGKAPRHTVKHCVAIGNKANGLYANHHLGGIDFLRNTAVNNGNYNMSLVNRRGAGAGDNVDVRGYGHKAENNYMVSNNDRQLTWANTETGAKNNYLVDAPNYNVDTAALMAPRKANGMLSEATLNTISKLRPPKAGMGADFGGYAQAIDRARRLSGADAR